MLVLVVEGERRGRRTTALLLVWLVLPLVLLVLLRLLPLRIEMAEVLACCWRRWWWWW